MFVRSSSRRCLPLSAPYGGPRFLAGMRGKALLTFLAVTCAFIASSAFSQTAAKKAPAKVDACSVLKTEEVAAALKMKVSPGERNDSGITKDGAYSSTCLWRVESSPGQAPDPSKPLGGASFAILNVMSWPAGSGDAGKFLESFREAHKAQIIPREPVPVELGDEALWWGDGVAVRKGDVSFGISVWLPTSDRSTFRSMEESLARRILTRI